MSTISQTRPSRTTIALKREDYEAVDSARAVFNSTHGLNTSRSSFIKSLAVQYLREHREDDVVQP